MSNIFHFHIAAKKSFHVFLTFFLCLFVYLFFTSRSSPLSVIHASADIKILVEQKKKKKDSALIYN